MKKISNPKLNEIQTFPGSLEDHWQRQERSFQRIGKIKEQINKQDKRQIKTPKKCK